ncbi:RidA family protein [Sphingobium nicotianae]|uniref:RidA family protein n=1 Tax=Sphingobium nicotianae TaxID=2782607 RepID=A0A9X1DBQ0_9SPHN|nr:RidA family protein [Sphingobium nicotianae]MBT2187039.1 RidA family protein [Sphingobium nicotianae]
MSDDPIRIISTVDAPQPAGHYSQAIVGNGTVYIAGQLPIGADRVHRTDASFEDQARQAIGNLLAILKAAGGDPRHLLKVTAYIVGIENWPRFNAVYAEMMGDAKPARTVVPVPELHHGYLVEVDAVGLIAV